MYLKILFIGHFREGSGWANSAIDYVLAMDSVGLDVVPRTVKLGGTPGPLPERFLELEKKSSRDCNVAISFTLPHHFEYHGAFDLNIGLYSVETSDFRASGWARKINMLDEAWVPCEAAQHASGSSGVEIPVHVIPHTFNTGKYKKDYGTFPNHEICENFTFYTIGEFVRRKNLADLVKAFHLEFRRSEPVALAIKTSKFGMPPDKMRGEVQKFCDEVKSGLKLYKNLNDYKKEVIITDRLSEEQLYSLHQTADVFVLPSRGEACGIPAVDGMAFGKTPIVTEFTGLSEYVPSRCGYHVDSNSDHVFGTNHDDTFPFLFCGREQWENVDIRDLRSAMRQAYEDKQLRKEKATNCKQHLETLSYESVGQLIKETLECSLERLSSNELKHTC